MVQFTVNGKNIVTDKNFSLLEFLREDLKISSVKDGCSEGACGSCTVIIDGKAKNSCTQKLDKLDNCKIITVEGLSDRERAIYTYAFSQTGAVQCGFCIPGMIMSGKALLDLNNKPTDSEIAKALVRNICRCTGYKKIIEALKIAASIIRDKLEIPQLEDNFLPGSCFPRTDAEEKILGTGVFTDDMYLEGMVYGSALRTKYPRARIISINTENALKHPDALTVLTASDIPGINKTGHLVKDWDVLIAEGSITRYIGDALALVASRNKDSLEEIKKLVEVEYEILTPLSSPEEAMKKDAPLIHENGNILDVEVLKRGEDVEEIFSTSANVLRNRFKTPFTEHAFMEPECAVAVPEDDGITVYTGSQSVYDEQREIAPVLGIDKEKVRCISNLVGGGFGGKEDMSVQHHAALLAYILKTSVKVKLSRQESILVHPKRHAMDIDLTLSCDEKGILTAMKAEIISDTGAYASLGGPVLQRACTHASGPYNFHNISIKGTAVYTNNPPAGAYRGFGVPQSNFAMESSLNLLAEKAGISPFDIRYINAVKPGDVLPNGQYADRTTALVECLEKVRNVYHENKYAGIACAFKNSGLGVGVPDTGRCRIKISENKLHVYTSAARIGQGLDTVIMQIVCSTLDISPELVVIHKPDTELTPNSGTTTASRQTLFTGEAVRKCCLKVKDAGKPYIELPDGEEFYDEYSGITDPINSTKAHPVSHIAYSYGVQVVILDENGKLVKVETAYDVGQIINRKNVEGQIEGGVVMSLGYALTEDYPLCDSIPQVKFATLGLFRADKVPEIISHIVDKDFKSELAYGGKGIGEIASIPTAPAVQGAYYSFDKVFRTSLPLEKTFYSRERRKSK